MKRVVTLSLALLIAGHHAARVKKRTGAGVHHIAGVPIHNYAALFDDDRAQVLKVLHQDSSAAREPWIITLRHGLLKTEFESITQMKGVVLSGHSDAVPFVSFMGTEDELEELLEVIKKDVEAVEPDMLAELFESNFTYDPHHVETASVNATSDGPCIWNLHLIGRDSRPATGMNVNVYVMDTGIRTSHMEFRRANGFGAIYCSGNSCAWANCRPGFSNDYTLCHSDKNGHGTHVAGTIGGIRLGIAPNATLHAVKVMNDEGQGAISWLVKACDEIVQWGRRPGIVSMSLGASRSSQSRSFEMAVMEVNSQGFTVVVASGNDNANACDKVPAAVPSAITVGSMKRDMVRAEIESTFSNYGTCVDILAPGEKIWAAWPQDDGAIARLDGTSMACPHVSAVAAIILERYPLHIPSDVWNAIRSDFSRPTMHRRKPGTANRRLSIGRSTSDSGCDLEDRTYPRRGLSIIPCLLLALLARPGW